MGNLRDKKWKLTSRKQLANGESVSCSCFFNIMIETFSVFPSSPASDCSRIFKTHCCNWRNGPFFICSYFQLTMEVGLSIQLNSSPTLKNDLFSFSSVAASVRMPCIHTGHVKLYVRRKFSTYFS